MPRFRARGRARVARRRTRKPSRRSAVKKRTYRRRRTMTKKSILNITSRKKRNGMLTYSNTTTTGATRAVTNGNLYVGPTGHYSTWCATAQDLNTAGGGAGVVSAEATRTATTCYMRGLSEHIRIQTSSGIPWFWRRICFTTTADDLFNVNSSDTPVQGQFPYVDTSNGIERVFMNTLINNQGATNSVRDGIIFRGEFGKDWDDRITAQVDPRKVTLKFDKTWTIRSGNANGTAIEKKLWHRMNRNLVYADDENGDIESTNYYSVDSKAGMGDYWVVDIIQPGTGATSTDLMQLSTNSTLYWHER